MTFFLTFLYIGRYLILNIYRLSIKNELVEEELEEYRQELEGVTSDLKESQNQNAELIAKLRDFEDRQGSPSNADQLVQYNAELRTFFIRIYDENLK